MPEHTSDSEVLLEKIGAKRQELSAYLARCEPRHSRLINSSIVSGSLAATLTAGPGVGGGGFIESAKGVVSFGIPVWQVLCLAATILSVLAVIANGMLKSHNLAPGIASARKCDAKLEGLETLLELGQVDVKEATRLYTGYLTEVSHV